MRRLALLLTAVGLVALVVVLTIGSLDGPDPRAPDGGPRGGAARDSAPDGPGAAGPRGDRAEIAGTVRRIDVAIAARVEVRRLLAPESDLLATPVGSGPAHAIVETGRSGEFLVRDLSPGRYEVRATTADGATGSAVARIRLPGARVLVDIAIPAGAHTLLGHVVHADGRPWHGLVAAGEKENQSRALGPSAVATDEEGRFAVPGLDPGVVRVSCLQEGVFRFVGNLIRIPHDGEVEIVVDLGATVLAGRIVADDDGSPVAGATVTVTGDTAQHRWCSVRARTGEDGRFRTRVFPIWRTIEVRAEGYSPAHRDLDDDLETIEIRLERAAALRGRVLSAGDERPCEGVSVTWVPLDPYHVKPGGRTLSDAAGRYAFGSVPDGAVVLYAHGAGWVSPGLAAIDPGGANPLVRRLEPGADAEVDLLVVPAVRVRGRIVSDGGVGLPGVTIRAVARDGLEELPPGVLETVSGAEGEFAFDGLVPDVTGRIHADPPGRAPVLGPPVVGSSGETVEVVLVVSTEAAPPRWLELLVLETESDEPVAGARAFAGGRQGKTSGDGRARMGPLPPGPISVWVHHPDYVLLRDRPILEESSGVITQTVRLRRGLAVAGRVLLPDGSPLENGTVWVKSMETQESAAPGTSTIGEVTEGGRFRAGGLLAGKVEVRIGGTHDDGGYWVTTVVDAGREDLVLTTERYVGEEEHALELRVLDAAGRPVPSATVDVRTDAGERSWTDDHEVVEGRATIEFWGRGGEVTICVHGARTHSGSTLPSGAVLLGPIDLADGKLVVRLPGDARIRGTVREAGGRGVAGVRVEAHPTFGEKLEFESAHAVAYTDERGSFRLGGLAEAEYRVFTTAPAAFLRAEPVVAKAGTRDLDIDLRRGATVLLTVVDAAGEPVSGAHVGIVEEESGRWRGREATTRRDGVARLVGVDRSFAHTLRVVPPRADLLNHARRGWRPTDERVVLAAGRRVAGVVRGPGGRVATGVIVHARPEGGEWEWKEVARDGSFRFGPYPEGPVLLQARRKEVSFAEAGTRPVTVAAGREDVVLTCGAGRSLVLRIVDWSAAFGPVRARISRGSATWWEIVGSDGTVTIDGLSESDPVSVWVGPVGDGLYLLLRDLAPAGESVDARLAPGGTVEGRLVLPPRARDPGVRLDGGGFTMSAAVGEGGAFRFTGVPDECVVTSWATVDRERVQRHAWTRPGETVVIELP